VRALAWSVLAVACASSQHPAAQGDRTTESELTLRLDPDEDPAHALDVATARLASLGVTRADVTAATGSLSLRLPRAVSPQAARALRETAWMRGLAVDESRDLSALLPAEGVRGEVEAVTLAPGLTLQSVALRGERAALAALASRGEALTVVPEGEVWRLVALRREVVAHGGAVTHCARRGEREVALALAGEAPTRRWVLTLNGEAAALVPAREAPVVRLAGATDAEALLARCAHGMLRGPLRADDQSPSQGTGSSVAP
jgi:hypothetical protein